MTEEEKQSYVDSLIAERAARKRARMKRAEAKWRKSNMDVVLSAQRRRRAENNAAVRAKEREAYYPKHYGITRVDRDNLLVAQGGRCAICPNSTPGSVRGWHIDHCHTTGKIRGILCKKCNTGLGHFNDNPEMLRKAAEYLDA